MIQYLASALAAVAVTLAVLYFWVGVPVVHEENVEEPARPHLYGDPSQSIEQIEIVAFYFVPKNKAAMQIVNWSSILQENLQKLKTFHEFQFLERSRITWRLYPEPIIGQEDNLAYDTDVTQHGNPEALDRISEELASRVFTPGGDRYKPDITQENPEAYRVWVIMYEGVGATASENVAFLSRTFLTHEDYRLFGPTFLAHEFYHTLGLPDRYEASVKVFEDGQEIPLEILNSEDLMGRVRVPIEYAYLERETLKNLGL